MGNLTIIREHLLEAKRVAEFPPKDKLILVEVDRALAALTCKVEELEKAEKKALAALDEIESAEPIFTQLMPDPLDERSGLCGSLEDWEKLRAITAGTKLYAHPPLAVPNGFQLVPDTAMVGLVELVKEVVESHSDSESCEYQECEREPCLYCQDANKFISLLSTNEAEEQT